MKPWEWCLAAVCLLLGVTAVLVPFPQGPEFSGAADDGINTVSGFAGCLPPIVGAVYSSADISDAGVTDILVEDENGERPTGLGDDIQAAAEQACMRRSWLQLGVAAPFLLIAATRLRVRRSRRTDRAE